MCVRSSKPMLPPNDCTSNLIVENDTIIQNRFIRSESVSCLNFISTTFLGDMAKNKADINIASKSEWVRRLKGSDKCQELFKNIFNNRLTEN